LRFDLIAGLVHWLQTLKWDQNLLWSVLVVFWNHSYLVKFDVADVPYKAMLLFTNDSHALMDLNCVLSMMADHQPE